MELKSVNIQNLNIFILHPIFMKFFFGKMIILIGLLMGHKKIQLIHLKKENKISHIFRNVAYLENIYN